jgi:hypothetical protein
MHRAYPLARRCCRLACAFALVLGAAGCGGDGRKPVFPVTGAVLIDGKPADGAVVGFHPAGELDNQRALRSTATTEPDGTFQLNTYLSQDGAPAGEYVVTVYWPGPLPPDAHPGDVGPDRLGRRYADPKTSPLRATLGEGVNDLEPFQLTGP